MIRNPRQQCARTARGRILLAALIAAALLGLGAQPAMALVPNDEFFAKQWGDSNTGQLIPTQNSQEELGSEVKGTPGADDRAAEAWGVTTGSKSIVIAEADTGVEYEHPDLKANIWTNPGSVGGCPAGTHGFNVVSEPEKKCEPLDEEPSGAKSYGGHGTHVAGIMGAAGNNGIGVAGMNWQTSILPVKWLESAGGANSTENLVKALEAVVTAKKAGVNIRVVNDSPTFLGTPYSQRLSEEIDVLAENNILFVTAAGNTGENIDEQKGVRYPCGYDGPLSGPKGEPPHPRPNEICVTATDSKDQLPSWANYGPSTVDLSAPGESIYSTLRGGKYGYLSGGSMAAAQVSGAAALILSVKPELTAAELKTEILNRVDKLPSLKGKVRTEGRLDVARALPGAVISVSPNNGLTGGGTSITITGANLSQATAVKFGASNATQFKVNSATSITATSPAGSGTVDVTVTTPGGTSATNAGDQFTYSPAITSVSPSSGPTDGGTTVTITGNSLAGASAVKFGTTNATSFTMNTPTSITATSPAGTGTVDVIVTTRGGTSAPTAGDQFTYAPAITSVSPGSGPVAGGTSVTIIGESLAGATAVKFGSSNATQFKVISPTSITATSPTGAGTVDVTVTTPGGTSTTGLADQFSYVAETSPLQTPTVTQSAPAPQTSVLATTTSSSSVVLTSTTLTVQHGRAAIKLRCVGSSACRGTLTITVKLEVHQHGKPTKTRVLSIGRAGFSLSAGQAASVAVTLTANGRRLLSAAHGHLNALLTILKSATGPGSTQSRHVRLILRASSAKRSGG